MFASLAALQTLCLSVEEPTEVTPFGAVPAVIPALTQFELFGLNSLADILDAVAMPALTRLSYNSGYGAQDLSCISRLTSPEELCLRSVALYEGVLDLGALPRLLHLDLRRSIMHQMEWRGGTVLQTLALDYDALDLEDEAAVAAIVDAFPCLRQLNLYIGDNDDEHVGGYTCRRLLHLAQLQSTLMARGCLVQFLDRNS